jgi:hypothetical protein
LGKVAGHVSNLLDKKISLNLCFQIIIKTFDFKFLNFVISAVVNILVFEDGFTQEHLQK